MPIRRYGLVLLLVLSSAIGTYAQQPLDRSHPPQAGPPPALHLPAVHKAQLSNGLRVWMVEQHKVPVAQVNLVVFSGAADDAAGHPGIASLTAAMLENGAGSQSALEIADAIDFLGADLGTASGVDASTVRLHVPVARLAEALPIMADVALHPTFPAGELDRLRRQRLTSILQAREEPGTVASIAFAHVLYPPGHPYATPTFGTAAAIEAVKPDDLRAFYQRAYRPDNAALVVTGDTTPAAVMPMLEKAFGRWTSEGGPVPAAKLPPAPEPSTRTVYLVNKPDAAQSEIRIGWIGVPRSTPDYFPLQVMNTILGGSFSSRLNMNLREKHGYTYGAGSVFEMRVGAGPFGAGAGVQTDKTAEALKEFFNELQGILQPVPADELSRAKHYVALRFPAGFETTGDVSRRLEDQLVYHLPDDYFAKYVDNIEAVTAADVERVAKKYIQPGRFAVVVVGDLKAVEAGVRALNLGPIKMLTLDDLFGAAPTM